MTKTDIRRVFLASYEDFLDENDGWKPFARAVDDVLTHEHRRFLGRIMKLDPRDRPTAKELLQDEWFEEDRRMGDVVPYFVGPLSLCALGV